MLFIMRPQMISFFLSLLRFRSKQIFWTCDLIGDIPSKGEFVGANFLFNMSFQLGTGVGSTEQMS